MKKLSPYEVDVMFDKGFNVDTACNKNNVGLIRPPFLRRKNQFLTQEAKDTSRIAGAHVHVERAIQRLKVFKLLKGDVPWELLTHIDDLMLVAAGLVNLSVPILNDDKFYV